MSPDPHFCSLSLSLKVLALCKSRVMFSLSFLGLSLTVVQVFHATKVPFGEVSGGEKLAQALPLHPGCL